jgi:hypothetical protein
MRAHTSPASGRWQDIPIEHPHVDYAGTPGSMSVTRTKLQLPASIHKLFDISSHYAILSMWQPLKTVQKHALTVCNATTVPLQLPNSSVRALYGSQEYELTLWIMGKKRTHKSGGI